MTPKTQRIRGTYPTIKQEVSQTKPETKELNKIKKERNMWLIFFLIMAIGALVLQALYDNSQQQNAQLKEQISQNNSTFTWSIVSNDNTTILYLSKGNQTFLMKCEVLP